MRYLTIEPQVELKGIIKNFWIIASGQNTTIKTEKIVPDGYPELIFHYRDPYEIKIAKDWVKQSRCLIAGQFRNFFFLKNSGAVGMLGIKLQPWALQKLFGINMSKIVDRTIDFNPILTRKLKPLIEISLGPLSFHQKIKHVENWFMEYLSSRNFEIAKEEFAVNLIIAKKGNLSIQEVLKESNISERSLERYFNTHIGLSPKFYSRIIRFSHIFALAMKGGLNWSDITYQGGFYDQSHFIKNFREFTGEEPSKYGFSEENMANFFLGKC